MTAKTTRRNFLLASTVSLTSGLTGSAVSGYSKPRGNQPGGEMKISMATRSINPKNGGIPRGHGSKKRLHDIHSELRVQAAVLEDQDGKKVLFLACDLCGVEKRIIDEIKNIVKEKHGIEPDEFCFNCSHTHSAPAISIEEAGKECFDEEYSKFAFDQMVGVIDDAMKESTPAKLAYKEYLCTSVGINRRRDVDGIMMMNPNPDGPVDHRVEVIEIKSGMDNSLMGVMVKYACHPVTVGPVGLGPDYPGFMREFFEKEHPGATAMFIQGCAGDVRIQRVNEDVTMFKDKMITAEERFKTDVEASIEASRRFGRDLGLCVEWALQQEGEEIAGPIKTSLKTIKLPLQKYSKETIQEISKGKFQDSWLERIDKWAKNYTAKIEAGEELPVDVDFMIQAISIGQKNKRPFIFVGLESEVTTEYGFKIAEQFQNSNVIVAGYCNDRKIYIPTAQILGEGGYEADVPLIGNMLPARFAPEIEPMIIKNTVELIRKQFTVL